MENANQRIEPLMNVTPEQPTFERIVHFDVETSTRRLLLMDQARNIHLVDWSSGQVLELSRFVVPNELHQATLGRDSHWNANILDLRLGQDHAAILTTEGFWTCDSRQDSQWTRVAGHPNDPPEGMNPGNKLTFGFKGPLSLGQDGTSYRRGMSRPVILSADGNTVVGAPNTRDILGGVTDYALELKSLSVDSPEPTIWPVKLRSAVESMALSSDGSVIAFSQGRDFRTIKQGQKRTQQFLHNKMFVRGIALSADGRFAAASGRYPSDLGMSPHRTVVWDVESREVLETFRNSYVLGFLGSGQNTALALTTRDHEAHQDQDFWKPHRLEEFSAEGLRVLSFPADLVQEVRGDVRLLAIRTHEDSLHIML